MTEHENRRWALAEMAEAGVSDATLMAVSGHMCRRMLERYSHVRWPRNARCWISWKAVWWTG